MPAENRFDTVGVAPLIDGIQFYAMIADKAFESDWLVTDLNECGAKIVISQHPRRRKPLEIDLEVCKFKEFKRIAPRSGKTDQSFSAMIRLAASLIRLR